MENEEIELKQYSLKDASVLKKLLFYIKPYMKWFVAIILLDVFVNAAFNMDPLIVRFLIDSLTAASNGQIPKEQAFQFLMIMVMVDVALWIFAGIGGFYVNLSLKKIGQKVVKDMRDDLFSHVLSLSLADLRKLKIGSYVTRITNDTQNISMLFSDIAPQVLRAVLSLTIIMVTTFASTGFYGFIFLAYVPFVFTLSFFFNRQSRKYYRAEKKCVSEMNSFLSEAFQGVKVTKTYNREDKKQKEFLVKNNNIRTAFVKSQNLFAFYYPFMYLLQISCVVILFSTIIPNIDGHIITIGIFQMLFQYSTQFFQPIQTITQLMNMLQQTISSAERIIVVENEKEESQDNVEELIDVPSFKGKIEFKHVYFAYEGDDYVLKDVSFVINPGETAAFVGATGAGKSTIISLISRTYEINSGEILIDDVPLQKYTLTCLRRNIGMMLQDVFIFSGNIKDNVSLGNEEVSDQEIKDACEYVGADHFIKELPYGYETKVSERGENFSAGQRQLISFARTIVYHPSLVLLDEATANIDTETENIIQSSLEKMRSIGTMIIVAHRLSTIKNANVIFVVNKGRIIEHGNHQELLKLKGNYYNLYRLQNMEKNLGNNKESTYEND